MGVGGGVRRVVAAVVQRAQATDPTRRRPCPRRTPRGEGAGGWGGGGGERGGGGGVGGGGGGGGVGGWWGGGGLRAMAPQNRPL